MNKMLGYILLLGLFLISCNNNEVVNEGLQYTLTADNISDLRISEFQGEYQIDITLTKPQKQIFADLTGKNIGKELQIVFQNEVIVSAIIKVKIDSGMIAVGKLKTKEEAEKLMRKLKIPE